MADLCKTCGANLAMVGRAHRCVPTARAKAAAPMKSDGGVEGNAGPKLRTSEGQAKASPRAGRVKSPESTSGRADKRQQAGIKPGPSDTHSKPKRGRPRIGEPRVPRPEPWKDLGMSERTYYRRQAAKRDSK